MRGILSRKHRCELEWATPFTVEILKISGVSLTLRPEGRMNWLV